MMYGRFGGGPGFGGHMMGGSWFGVMGMVLNLLFWIVIIVLAVKFFRHNNFKGIVSAGKEDNALALLRERYAKGEIDTDEFNRRKEDLLR